MQALRNQPITLYGDGQQTRSFCYVDDLIDAFILLMNAPDEVPIPMNLGNPGEFSMRELAEQIRDLTGSGSPIIHQPLPSDDPQQRRPDIGLAREHIGWEPRIPLTEGLQHTIAYFERFLEMRA